MSESVGLDLLPEPDNITLKVLILLLNKSPIGKSGVYTELEKSNKTVQPRIDKMVDSGLISAKSIAKPFGMIKLSLTPKGRQVAEKLAEIEKILKG